ncbi:MAG: peptidase [Acidobacteriales bacterium]|nr:peptidase [Terriglobales bacterium]
MNLTEIQAALRARNFDAWLFYDHHHRDPIAYHVLGLPESLHVTRRWYYVVPAEGEPVKLVHRIESFRLDSLPGKKHVYSAWQEQHEQLKSMLSPYKNLAMQYSPNNSIPYISLVDGGTIELLRSFGKNIMSSGDLVSQFEATWTEDQIKSHFAAGESIDGIMRATFKEIGARVRNGGTTEHEIQDFIMEAFKRENLVTDAPANVSVNANSGNPHYGPSKEKPVPIRKGDFVLLDIWGKKDTPNAVFYDITWTGVVDATPTSKQQEIFNAVTKARDVGFAKVKSAIDSGKKIAGWEVDQATRDSIESAGYGKYFVHRTGHSIGVDIHANGANMDNLETKDEREILPNSCFSIEPGIYLPEFGVRSEYDVLVRNGKAEITGKVQNELVLI